MTQELLSFTPGGNSRDRFSRLLDSLEESPFWAGRKKGWGHFFPDQPDKINGSVFVEKFDLLASQRECKPFGTIPTVQPSRLVRIHQSSGTSGNPLVWGDTSEDWSNLLDQWDELLEIAGAQHADRFFFPFSFGPFLGFWSAFEAVARSGRFCLAGGGMTSVSRLRLIEDHHVSVILTTPSYAAHLAEVAKKEGIDLANGPVRMLILAGEPGASIPGKKKRLEAVWGAKVLDHHGMTEVGPVSMECPQASSQLHLLDSRYLIETLSCPKANKEKDEGLSPTELILTPYSRLGMPLVRYRTGDRVRLETGKCLCGRIGPRLMGGILGRLDDMMIVKGNNLYPNAVEEWVWSTPSVTDFQGRIIQKGEMTEMKLMVELAAGFDPVKEARNLEARFSDRFLFHVDVIPVETGSLPPTEHKSKRWVQGTD